MIKEFLGGFCVGVSQVVVGHPLDTIKVLLQNNKPALGHPIRNYYFGWKFPALSSLFYNSIAFPVYEANKSQGAPLAGAIAGAAATPLVYILDLGKIKQQMKMPISIKTFHTVRGLPTTALREVLATSSYFGAYEFSKERTNSPLLSGGIAGLANWTLTYPIDTIRTRQIAQNISPTVAFKQGALWKGYAPCAARAIIVNSISFVIYDSIMTYF